MFDDTLGTDIDGWLSNEERKDMAQRRYARLIELVEETKPGTIVEVGVFNGKRAIQMAEAALKHRDDVHYAGYDLFDARTDETDAAEFNKKATWTKARVAERLAAFQNDHPGFSFDLIAGNTRETLNDVLIGVDFAYIDGGHSLETIRNDYAALKHAKTIVFDDYYEPNDLGECPDLERFGANAIVNDIPGVQIIDTGDKVAGGGYVCLAVVRNQRTW